MADPDDLPPKLAERYDRAIYSLGPEILELGSYSGPETSDPDLTDAMSVAYISRMQFGLQDGIPADAMLFGLWDDPAELANVLRIIRSKRTGKIRNVLLQRAGESAEHLLSLRAEDGLFSLKWRGAVRLHAGSKRPFWRVQVEEGTGEFNEKGFNVFNKFVLDCDPAIRPGDEVMVVGRDDRLHAVGRAVVDAATMVSSRNGTAVKVREGREKAEPPSSTA
jgi:7-cyano-7-deazaguanine tRNA-ribosyltransferase